MHFLMFSSSLFPSYKLLNQFYRQKKKALRYNSELEVFLQTGYYIIIENKSVIAIFLALSNFGYHGWYLVYDFCLFGIGRGPMIVGSGMAVDVDGVIHAQLLVIFSLFLLRFTFLFLS